MHLLWLILPSNHIGKGHEYQICLYGRIDYSFVPSKKSEVRKTENLRHVTMKARR